MPPGEPELWEAVHKDHERPRAVALLHVVNLEAVEVGVLVLSPPGVVEDRGRPPPVRPLEDHPAALGDDLEGQQAEVYGAEAGVVHVLPALKFICITGASKSLVLGFM